MQVMSTWTRQKGYPVITLAKSVDGTTYSAEQRRFLIAPDAHSLPDTPSQFGYKWEVPLTFIASEDKKETRVWMHKDGQKLDM